MFESLRPDQILEAAQILTVFGPFRLAVAQNRRKIRAKLFHTGLAIKVWLAFSLTISLGVSVKVFGWFVVQLQFHLEVFVMVKLSNAIKSVLVCVVSLRRPDGEHAPDRELA
ncbi:hypothetical protein LZK35_15345 [Pseudomonas aeruginosa]|nr:hypothetical protein [Pseudomonas aeruginosa]